MTLLRMLKRAVTLLEKTAARYCLVGGHAASLYRAQERLTRDIDFALVASNPRASREVAGNVIQQLGFRPIDGFLPHGVGEKRRVAAAMVSAAPKGDEEHGIIDILLPELPWITEAVERAQYNKIDLGFARVPVITPEDLVLAKCYALKNSPDRFQDLDDLKAIFSAIKDLDLDYLDASMARLKVVIPEAVARFAPSSRRS